MQSKCVLLRLVENPRKVITRMDIPPGYRVVSMDNSVYARLTGEPDRLKSGEGVVELRRLLALFGNRKIRSRLRIQFVYSQALHYDRIRDRSPESVIRLLDALLIAAKVREHKNVLMEWPVARVEALLELLPQPTSTKIEEQEGQVVERRMTPITRFVNPLSEVGKSLKHATVGITLPLCVYQPDGREDDVARAFGFTDFTSCPSNRIADVCHAASHLRFAKPGDVLLALDKHFLNNQSALKSIGIRCLSPAQFLTEIDPHSRIRPADSRDQN